MNIYDMLDSLAIFMKYFDDPIHRGYSLGAEHDTFYVYPTDKPISVEDLYRLIALGWVQEHQENNFEVIDYDPEQTWVCRI